MRSWKNSILSKPVKVTLAIPTMGYTHAEAYCNRLINFLHLGYLEQEGKVLHAMKDILLARLGEEETTAIFNEYSSKHHIYWTKDGTRFEFALAVVGRIFTPVARDQAARLALQGGMDYLFMIDDDMIAPDDTFERLYAHNVDIVAPLAFTRNAPHKPVIYAEHGGYDPVSRKPYMQNVTIQNYPKNQLVECDAVGFGAVLIKMDVFKKLQDANAGSEKWFMSTCGTGEDIYFCYQAKKVGARVFMDTATKLGHLGAPLIVDEAYVEKWRLEQQPDFYKIHSVHNAQEKAGKHPEGVFVTGDYCNV